MRNDLKTKKKTSKLAGPVLLLFSFDGAHAKICWKHFIGEKQLYFWNVRTTSLHLDELDIDQHATFVLNFPTALQPVNLRGLIDNGDETAAMMFITCQKLSFNSTNNRLPQHAKIVAEKMNWTSDHVGLSNECVL